MDLDPLVLVLGLYVAVLVGVVGWALWWWWWRRR